MTTTAQAGAQAPAASRKARTKKPTPTGADRIPKPSQGWYRDPITGDKLRRVTTILEQGCTKGDALTTWAGNITAETAMEHLPRLVAASRVPEERAEITTWLKRAHHRKKDERKDVGTAVHTLIEAHVLGTPVPEELLNDDELAPFLRHFERFVEEWQVDFEASEMVVGHREHGYAGTLDYLLRSPLVAAALAARFETDIPPRSTFMGDTKTGGELDIKGVYPEASLQMSAYRKAEIAWLRDGSTVPMPDTSWAGVVLHLRPEGYRLIPAVADDAVFEAFLTVKRNAEWTSGLSKKVIGSALTLPTATEERAA
ncbi:hypothetical protein [Streptomyces iconiensis]|uniref:DUF4238 domain-containing protein n=1 Tax=Streptomyces iconiensis TaxID=1384038 RepID=A0ABT6ZUB1_9ACTN|nr:hypothetical protein [Streptomyces iconiensis]MDJ1132447.1 hypothetical protein [Streptomyces iconiensis]